MKAFVVFPHQLFGVILKEAADSHIYLIEHHLYFTQFRFHPQKLVLHRASMKAFAVKLSAAGACVTYCGIHDFPTLADAVSKMKKDGVRNIVLHEVVDDWLERDIKKYFTPHFSIKTLPTPMFLTTQPELDDYFRDRKIFRMSEFYILQRRRFKILVDEHGKPEGGQWSFDKDNRKPIPKSMVVPPPRQFPKNQYVIEAELWVKAHFSDGYGSLDGFDYPTSHEEARLALEDFLTFRLAKFGDFEDAMRVEDGNLFHSKLTPALNIGLITPREVIDAAMQYSAENAVPINALEGFIRQIIGWREFIHGVYTFAGGKQRTCNTFGFSKKIPSSFWNGTTGLVPADTVIHRVLTSGYCHHIERLMVLGSLMLLCEFDPDEVYAWFMTLFIDAYDWVMVPNVYGMSQFADNGLMATKPYICGSAYLQRMGDWQAGDWTLIWDGLYWRFVDCYREKFAGNQRVGFAPLSFDKLASSRRELLLETANTFLNWAEETDEGENS